MKKKGISLIVLVITIIVIIILAGAVILNLSGNNPIDNAKKAQFNSDLDAFNSELLLYKTNQLSSTIGEFEPTSLQANESSVSYRVGGEPKILTETITDIITKLKNSKYESIFEIVDGELVYKGTNIKEQQWAYQSGVKVDAPQIKAVIATTDIEAIKPGAKNIIYTMTLTSNSDINNITSLDGKIVMADKDGNELPEYNSKISIGEIIGTAKQKNVTITINTAGITDGEYKIKLKENSVQTNVGIQNKETLALTFFTIDGTAPTPPEISQNPTNWTNGDVTITINYPEDALKKEYSLDGTNFNDYTGSFTVSNYNTTIWTKGIDAATNESTNSAVIQNIDKVNPDLASITGLSSTGNSITATVSVSDSLSGIDTSKCKYVIANTSTAYVIGDSVWDTANALNGSISSSGIADGDYYIQVLSVDNAGNKTVTISNKVTVNATGVTDLGYDSSKGVNSPVLKTGMTPIKWNGSAWVTTTSTDTAWYNYSSKQWANAQTADGSMWVWIPRYEYKIPTPHSSTPQTIAVNFIQGTATTATSGYRIHPAFTFGSVQLTGIWVAKFEATGTTSAIAIKPGISTLSNLTISNAFTACRNMETTYGSRYGWGTNGVGLDVHLTKNIEWGAILYITSSAYGRYPDPDTASGYTGCGSTTTTYISNTGKSTTGNIYGIYGINGGTDEFVSAYVNNGNSYLTNYGSVLVSAGSQYKDIYAVGSGGDSDSTNYSATSSKVGDAIWETSNNYDGTGSWYSGLSVMSYTTNPFFTRGKTTDHTSAYNFYRCGGYALSGWGFRPVITISKSL